MGVVECLNHNMVEPFNVLYEKDGGGMGELVVHNRAIFPAPGKAFLASCLLEIRIPHILASCYVALYRPTTVYGCLQFCR